MGETGARPLDEGEAALLIDRGGSRFIVHLQRGQTFQSHRGVIPHDRLIGSIEGQQVETSLGKRLRVFRPRLMDYCLEMPRHTAIVYPKDAACLLFWADIYPGARVVEAGLGSGALTLALLRAVGPTGRVIVYECRAEFIARALENIQGFMGKAPPLEIRLQDAYDGFDESNVDRLVLDLAEPWRVVGSAAAALRPGGIFAAYTPSISQVQRLTEALRQAGHFGEIETLEVLYRTWHVQGAVVRPSHQMIGHTGFLTVARRLAEIDLSEQLALAGR